MKLRTVFLCALGVSALLLAILATRHEPTDEEKVSALIDDVAEKAGRRDVAGILDHVSPSFRSTDRSLGDRDALKGLLLGALLQAGWAHVLVLDRHIEVVRGRRVQGGGGQLSPAFQWNTLTGRRFAGRRRSSAGGDA